jgi:hypothetical protein
VSAVAAPDRERAKAAAYRARLEADPVERIKTLNGWEGWSKQQEIVRALYRDKRVAVLSSHGTGKTSTAGAIVDDFMRQGPCRVVTTAPTWEQVESVLWAEINTRARAARMPWEKSNRPLKTKWVVSTPSGRDWRAVGLSPDVPERFQGHHGPRVLLIVDEASGVDDKILDAGSGFTTGANSYVLYIGNGTKLHGGFYKSMQPGSNFTRIQIGTFETPNFTDEWRELSQERRDALPSQQFVDNVLAECDGDEDHPKYRVRVLGEFALLDGRAYFSPKQLGRIVVEPPKRVGTLTGDAVAGGTVKFDEQANGPLRIWAVPDKSRRYIVFADTAGQVQDEDWEAREATHKGSGEDYCAAQVLDLETGVQVAEFREQMDPDVYGRMLARICTIYCDQGDVKRPAWLGVEANSMGQATLTELKHLRFRRLWRRQKLEAARSGRAANLGLVTTRDSRERMLAFLRSTVREAPGRVRSEFLLSELRSFIHYKGYGAAASGSHDDLVIAMSGALEMRDQVLRRPGSDEAAA